MLLNLHGELAEQPSSSDTKNGKNSLFTVAGKYLLTQKILASVHYPSWGMRTIHVKMEKLVRFSPSGWPGAVGWEVWWGWSCIGVTHLFDKALMLEQALYSFSLK